MINEGKAYGTALAVKQALALLERKGIITHGETVHALDDALAELDGMKHAITPEARADAGKAIGLLYLR